MRNKIVLVQFPFDDFTGLKVRPALCLTNSIGKYQHIVVAFISSKVSTSFSDTEIILEKQNITTGLKVDSVLKLHKLATVPEEIIISELGTINSDTQQKVNSILSSMFQLNK